MNANTKSNPNETCESIKLGIDAHAKWYYVGRQVDGATPQPVQKMTFEGLLRFVAKQKRLAGEVHTCYEAGPFGYHLHRKLTAMGVTNYVVQPRVWDERSKGVKTDKLDALALCQRLDRFALGNRKAFSIVRVPTRDEGPEGERRGTKESGRGRRPSAGRGPVATVHRPNHRRESRADLLAGSGVNSEHRHLQTMI